VTIVREWLSLGGPNKVALNNSMRTMDFVNGVGARFVEDFFGMDNAQVAGPHVDAFNEAFQVKWGTDSKGPGVHTQYDAVMVLGLAMNIAKDLTGPSIREAIRRVHAPDGTPVGTGPAEYRKALDLIRAGRPIKYYGATGPVEFDVNGDVTGPALVWKITGGKIETDRIISIEDMQALTRRIEN
jgi:ABC-type branched-subunit amino acid transport system substrate-binding protein